MTSVLTPELTAYWDEPDSFTLDAYRRNGGYQALPKALAMEPDQRHPDAQGLGPARPRRRGLPDRAEVGLHPAGRRQAALPGGQRRRVRAGRLQGHAHAAGQPAGADRGHRHRRLRDPGRAGLHLRARRGAARDPAAAPRRRRGLRRRATWAPTSWAPGSTWTSSCTPARAPTSAARRRRCSTRWRASAASPGSSRRSRRWRACTPCPTVVNNVESIATVPYILQHGAEEFAAYGTERSKGFGIFSLSGHVTRPGQYEAPLGTTLRELLELAGGIRAGHRLKFWTPGGSSTPLFTDEHLDVPLDYESVAKAGSMLGTRSVQLFDETTCVVRVVLRWIEFYRARVVRQVHAVPGGQLLGRADAAAAGARRGHRGRPGQAAGHLRATSPAGRSAPSATRSRRRSSRRSSTSGTSTSSTSGRAAARSTRPPPPCSRWSPPDDRTGEREHGRRGRPAGRRRDRHHRRVRDHRAQGHPGDPRRRAARDPDPAVLRPPAARPDRRLPPVPGADRGPAQAAGLLHHGLHRRHGRAHPAHLAGGREGPARHDGAAAGQPPARLPDVRQGRRVPAAEPGHVHRPGRDPVRRHQADLPQAHRAVGPGAAGPRAVHPVRPVHQVRRADPRRPADRAARPRPARAGRRGRGRAVRLLLLRQHRADLPGRRADRRLLPVPGPAVRPGVHAVSVCEHCAAGCRQRTDHRRGAVTRRLAGNDPEVNEEWNCDKGRWAFTYATQPDRLVIAAGPGRLRGAGAGLLAGGHVGRGPRPGRGAGRGRAC